jgi:tetratricopeptide (TPR) repeat protein
MTKENSVGYELFTTVLFLITGMMLLILPSISMDSLMNGTQSGETIIFLSLMRGLITILILLRLILLPHSWLFLALILEGVVQVLYGKALPVACEHFKAIEILQQTTCRYPNTVEYTAIGNSYKKLEETDEIEQSYVYAWYMNPSRFYPKYLLAKLYDESGQEKAVITAKELWEKQIKIESTVI